MLRFGLFRDHSLVGSLDLNYYVQRGECIRTDFPPALSSILDFRLHWVQRRRRRTISKDWAALYDFWLAETM